MFVKRTESLTASMPDTVLPPEDLNATSGAVAVAGSRGGPSGVAESAGGAAVALAGWAFTSLSSRLGNSDLATPMLERKNSSQSVNGAAGAAAPASVGIHSSVKPSLPSVSNSTSDLRASTSQRFGAARNASLPGGFGGVGAGSEYVRSSLSIPDFGTGDDNTNDAAGDWGGDLMDVQADEGDFDEFESAQPAPPPAPVVHPRFTITKTASSSPKKKPVASGSLGANRGMRLGGASTSGLAGGRSTNGAGSDAFAMNSVLKAIEAEEGPGDWSFDGPTAAGGEGESGADVDEATAAWGEDSETRQSQQERRQDEARPETPLTLASDAAASNGLSETNMSTAAAASTTSVGKEKLAQMKEERKARLAAAKAKKEAAASATAGKK